MTSDDRIRASDGEREGTVSVLRDAYVAGRLTLAEFRERTSIAFASRTRGELRKLTSDLPVAAGAASPAARHPDGLPPPRPASPGAGRPGTARPGMARLLPAVPIALVWVLVAVLVRGDAAYVLLLILLVTGLKLAGGGRSGGGDPGELRRQAARRGTVEQEQGPQPPPRTRGRDLRRPGA